MSTSADDLFALLSINGAQLDVYPDGEWSLICYYPTRRTRRFRHHAESETRTPLDALISELKAGAIRAKGVCPRCNRSFQNLYQHMKSEHPDFATESLDDEEGAA